MDIIHDMHAMNTNTLSHWNKFPEKCLFTSVKDKKNNNLESFSTSPPSLFQWMVSSAWRQRLWLNAYTDASRWNGSIPNWLRAATLIVGWQSPWSKWPTSVSRSVSFRHTISVCNNHSGRMEQSYTSSFKENVEKPNSRWNVYFIPSKTWFQKRGDL